MFKRYDWKSDDFLKELSKDSSHKIVCSFKEEPQQLTFGREVRELPINESIKKELIKRGIQRLFLHQERALELIKKKRNVFIVAGTGTGKTEAFLIPILDDIIKEPYKGVQAILIYPTKALARDQMKRIESIIAPFFGLRVAIYDGDTPEKERKLIYQAPPPILITNPDMIHVALQGSEDFKRIISNVKYLVLDDVHVYTGVFGTHVAYVLRRLLRIINHEPIFIATSATIGNPIEFITRLTGRDFEIVKAGTGKRSETIHTFIKPVGRSKIMEALALVRFCQRRGLKNIVFADSHRIVELMKLYAKRYNIPLEVHRAGLRKDERVMIEKALKEGRILSVAATPTLELGIDIGDLDVVILYSIPATFSRYMQRTGRSGRRSGRRAYVFTILGEDPISAYYERHPEDFFREEYDPAVIDLQNDEIAKIHLLAMARDRPLYLNELNSYERKIVSELISHKYLTIRGRMLVPTRKGIKLLKERMSLRGVGKVIKIYTEGGLKVGEREMPMALKELHPGAVYIHAGNVYLTLELKEDRAIVRKMPPSFNYITTALYYSMPENEKVIETTEFKGIEISYINLNMIESVYGYIVKSFPDLTTIREEILDKTYEYSFRTKGILIKFPPLEEWNEYQNAEAFHAIEHALIIASQTIIGASHNDLGGVSFPSGHIYIYDAYPGGSGLCKLLMKRFSDVVTRAYRLVNECNCIDGCPRCIYSPYCGNNNKILSRRKAAQVLRLLLEGELRSTEVELSGKPIV